MFAPWLKSSLPDDSEHDALAAVIEVDLVAGAQLHTRFVGLEALLFRQLDAVLHAKALGLAVVEELLVVLAIGSIAFSSSALRRS